MTHGQVVSELPYGFWRFLISRRYQNLWPDLAGGFPHAPNRGRKTVEDPVGRLHDLRNRLAHHQRVWSEPLLALHQDLLTVADYISPVARMFIEADSRVATVLADRP